MFKFLTFKKKRVLTKAYFKSQFKYYPLVRMFHGRQVKNKINHLHETSLQMICKESTSLYNTLLEKDKSFSVYNKTIQQLELEMYKLTKGLAPSTISSLFLQWAIPLKRDNSNKIQTSLK